MNKLILFFIFTLNLYAQNDLGKKKFSIYEKSGVLYLESKSCDQLLKIQDAFVDWKKVLREPFSKNKCSFSNKLFRLELNSVLPDLVLEKHGSYAAIDGPNCFNLALKSANVLSHLRYSGADELTSWLDSPLCKEVSFSERKAGDLIAIRSNEFDQFETHAMTYISDEISFSKNGFRKEAPYELQKTNDVFDLYKVIESCLYGNEAPCMRYTQWYRCESFSDHSPDLPEGYIEKKLEIDDLSCEISTYSFHGEFTGVDKNEVQRKLIKILKDLNQIKPSSERAELWWNTLDAYVASILPYTY